MIKILLDTMGGDHPEENIKGYELIKGKYDDLEVVMVKDNTPSESLKSAYEALKGSDEYSGLISMGETREVIIGAMNYIGLKPGVIRPVICPILPTITGGYVGLCDSGAIVNVTPEHMLQYAILGSEFMRRACNIENPRVALLNIGVEEEKGDPLHKEAFKLLKACDEINFVGNIEARDFQTGNYDLVVSDGFSGNIMLKAIEGINEIIIKLFGQYLPKEAEIMNYRNYAGAAVLGTNKLIMKVHGFGDARAIARAIEQAYFMAKNN